MPTPDAVRAALKPIADVVARLDLTDPAAAQATLDRELPLSRLGEVEALLKSARDEGWLTPKRAGDDVTFGRLAKPSPETGGLSVDVVDMGCGPLGAAGQPVPAAEHVHPNGEVSLCFADGGADPRFLGHRPGWVVVPPSSRHVPTVTGGRMLIAYFLPAGAMTWI